MYESYLDHVEKYGERDTTIERIDVNGNYCKENCRWATQQEQANNKTTTHFVTLPNGNIVSMKDASKELGIDYTSLRNGLYLGYTIDEIIKNMS